MAAKEAGAEKPQIRDIAKALGLKVVTEKAAPPEIDASAFKLTVLSPGGKDPEQYFDQPVTPESPGHAPVNFHAFAACTGGSFHRETKSAIAEKRPILLLLRGDFKATQRALTECRAAGRTVVVSLKETGLHQIAQQMADGGKIERFLDIVGRAPGCLAITPESADLYQQARPKRERTTVGFAPTPYPLEDVNWNFSVKPDKQKGIFIGTREWDVPSRNHFAALLIAKRISEATGEFVTVFNLDGRSGAKRLAGLNFAEGKLRVIDGRKPYAEYLRIVANHKIVLQLDRSGVPGQVAGDALLCRTICVGGDGVIERIAFPSSNGNGRAFDQIISIATSLVKDSTARATAIMESQWRALERIAFRSLRPQLAAFFAHIEKFK
jgi:hypothetical protein